MTFCETLLTQTSWIFLLNSQKKTQTKAEEPAEVGFLFSSISFLFFF